MTHLDVLKKLARKQARFMLDQMEENEEGDWEIDSEEVETYATLLKEIREVTNSENKTLLHDSIEEEDHEEEPEEEPETEMPSYSPGEDRKPPWKSEDK